VIIDKMLNLVGLTLDIKEKYPHELSGGQQQRVGIARAYANSPHILLMDEPFGAVDSITRYQLQKDLIKIHTETNCTIIFITHDIYEASYLDGCSPARRFFQIILPYIKPTIIVTLLLRTIWIFNSFDMIVIITNGGPANYSQTLPSYMYTKAFAAYDFGLASALGVILMGILAVYVTVFLTATKYNSAGDF